MKMSAQYRPYRNEDGIEAGQVTWGEQDGNDEVIYQRTTEDIHMVSHKNLIVGGIGIALIGGLVGLLVGYFAHSEHSECVPSLAVALHSVQDANPYVRRKIAEMVSNEEIENFIKAYSLEPHAAGSSTDHYFARKIKSEWLTHGLDTVEIVEYDVLLSYPDKEKLNVIKVFDQNDVVLEIKESRKKNLNPAFSPYSWPGNVTGNLVYVNYGQTSDFQYLRKKGIPLEDKIFIARHWKLPADEIVWNALQVKAAGLILYPDPDKYNPPILNSSAFPSTWWLPPNTARTDSVLWNGAGDPLTPGYPARHDANRLALTSALLPQLVVQPISYSNAYKLLISLEGEDAPQDWQGGFNFTYKLGPLFKNPSWKIQMLVYNQFVNKTIYNVIGTIRGKTEPDRYVFKFYFYGK